MTDAQREASRENGAKSHGPKTPEGKANASRNALRHGLTAKGTLLTNENPAVYQDHARAYYDKFEPADNVEANFVDEMIVSHWRQRRAWSYEAALIDLEMDRMTKEIEEKYDKIDHAARCALAFKSLADTSRALPLLLRYETNHRRAFQKALANLLQVRAATEAETAKRTRQAPETKTSTPPSTPATPAQNDNGEPPTNDERPTTTDNRVLSSVDPVADEQPANKQS